MIGVKAFLNMDFAVIGLDALCCLQCGERLVASRIGVIETAPVEVEMNLAKQTVSEYITRISPDRLLEQANALEHAFLAAGIIRLFVERARLDIKVVRDDVFGRPLRDGRFLARG